jgi:hypothetical protein
MLSAASNGTLYSEMITEQEDEVFEGDNIY